MSPTSETNYNVLAEALINLVQDIQGEERTVKPIATYNTESVTITTAKTTPCVINKSINVPTEHNKLWKALQPKLTPLTTPQGFSIDSFSEERDMKKVRPGDVISIPVSSLNYFFLITQVDKYGGLRTFPYLDVNPFPFDSITKCWHPKYEMSATAKITKSNTKETDQEANIRSLLKASVDVNDTFLQIGDLTFLVDPTQISFVTSNGYQYFPTMRTAGNPKIPTLQEVKTVEITLMFPNKVSINDELLPLFAMYKRTPFVHLFNKDICAFYAELIPEHGRYLPIALNTLQLSSVDGFPNCIQANISIFPFEARGVTNEFRVLLSEQDIYNQQQSFKDHTMDDIIESTKKNLGTWKQVSASSMGVITHRHF